MAGQGRTLLKCGAKSKQTRSTFSGENPLRAARYSRRSRSSGKLVSFGSIPVLGGRTAQQLVEGEEGEAVVAYIQGFAARRVRVISDALPEWRRRLRHLE